jgi:hypothetical protein
VGDGVTLAQGARGGSRRAVMSGDFEGVYSEETVRSPLSFDVWWRRVRRWFRQWILLRGLLEEFVQSAFFYCFLNELAAG